MKSALPISRRGLLGAGISAGALSVTPSSALQARGKAEVKRPNILFIVADDLGYADLSCYGSHSYKTPIIDQLAQGGVRLTNGYANSCVCSATRIGLITGKYQDRFRAGLEQPLGPPDMGLPKGIVTMPGALRSLGYSTSLIGKWHMGVDPGVRPNDHGYDTFYGIYGGATDYYRYAEMPEEGQLFENGRKIEDHRYLTDLFGDKGVSEIQRLASGPKPFMLSFHFTAPHWPWEGSDDKPIPTGPINESTIMNFDGGSVEIYARMVHSMDAIVGRLLKTLDDAGVADNTIVIFTSDNGGERFSDVWPLVGIKTELLEGGIRVPLIMRWPNRIAAGGTSDQVMVSMDFMPTLLTAVGNYSFSRLGLDGINLVDQLTGKSPPIDRTMHWRFKARDQHAVRSGDWKYLAIDGEEYLFDLATDERERANLKDKYPERFAELKKSQAAWEAEMLPYPADSYSHDMRPQLADI